MAAAYQSGTASDPTDLLSKLNTFLVAQGWTSDSFATDGAGKRAHLHKGSDYVNLRSAINEAVWPNLSGTAGYGIALYMGSGYNGSNGWAAQAGGPIKSGASDTVGSCAELNSGAITAYHFFDNGNDGITVVVERSGGIFTHFGFGRSILKSGFSSGGQYFFGAKTGARLGSTGLMGDASTSATAPFGVVQGYNQSSSTTQGAAAYIKVDVDSFTGKWVGFSSLDTTTPNEGYTGKLGHSGTDYSSLQALAPTEIPGLTRLCRNLVSTFNAQAVLMPIRAFVQRDAGGYSHIGQVPDLFFSSAVEQGFAQASLYTINGKTFMLFPRFAVRKYA